MRRIYKGRPAQFTSTAPGVLHWSGGCRHRSCRPERTRFAAEAPLSTEPAQCPGLATGRKVAQMATASRTQLAVPLVTARQAANDGSCVKQLTDSPRLSI